MAEMIFGGIFFLVGFGVFLIGLLKPPGTIIENAGIAMAAGAFFALIGLLVIILGIIFRAINFKFINIQKY